MKSALGYGLVFALGCWFGVKVMAPHWNDIKVPKLPTTVEELKENIPIK